MVTTDGAKVVQGSARRERFRRLAEQRTNAILDKLRVLGNCSNPYQYAYSDEEISKIFSTIDAEVKRVRSLFASQQRPKFKL